MTGIYGIFAKKIYIGSSINIEQRIKLHFSKLRCKSHLCKELQQDFDDKIEWKILEECSEEELLVKEQEWINKFTFDKLYNTNNALPNYIAKLNQNDLDRFWSKVSKSTECWQWIGSVRPNGYGRFSIKGVYYSAHRISYHIRYNHIQDLIVIHKCDNKLCVNPDHLMTGSHSQNHKDRCQKGIGCKINSEIANYIRNLRSRGLNAIEIKNLCYDRYDLKIVNTTIRYILQNKSFVTKNSKKFETYQVRGEVCPWAKLNQIHINLIRHLYDTTNMSLNDIANFIREKYNIYIGFKTIHKIIKNQRWKDPSYIPISQSYKKLLK